MVVMVGHLAALALFLAVSVKDVELSAVNSSQC